MKKSHTVTKIIKRDGLVVDFDPSRIENAIYRAMKEAGEWQEGYPKKVTDVVLEDLYQLFGNTKELPTVEHIQDLVEKHLILQTFPKTAKAYILYRQEHADLRTRLKEVPEHVRALANESKKYFKNQLAEFVFYSSYARWIPEKGRRETWIETIDRYMDFMQENLGNALSQEEYANVREHLLHMKAMGSMRLLWSAGKAAAATNVAAYNCSFVAPQQWRDFSEIMYVLMCGTGAGFSVERQNIELLPMIQRQTGKTHDPYIVPDSKEGWAEALEYGLATWASGEDVTFDYTQIRPRGARLETMGGRASGPEPLKNLLEFVREKMLARQGRRLTTLDVHDIVCKIGEIVVAGGVRRSALISLSDLDDLEMRTAKNGEFYIKNPQRMMANNSAVYNEKPTMHQFLDEWSNLIHSGSGERGIFNRGSLRKQLPERRWETFKDDFEYSGVNPCGEIILKSRQFCNLSTVVAEPDDTLETLLEKTKVATILGTYQASLTHFPYLSDEWKRHCEEEALLGVAITGYFDCPVVQNAQVLSKMKEVALETNRTYAKRFGINPARAVTCMKPSGNSSQLHDCSSGMHPRHAKYYIRRVRIEGHNPLKQLFAEAGAPIVPEVGQDKDTATTFVIEFPVKSPEGTVVKDDLSALEQLKHWKMVKEHFCEHNPSVTVSVSDEEWLSVGDWVYKNWDMVGGLSFLPRTNHVYQLAPYEEISKNQYEDLVKRFPAIDFSDLVLYEHKDTTEGAKEYACVAGTCEIDVVPQMESAEQKV